ncbi:MAG: hypothetical protein Q9180_004283 [Flavoplaca navasiana]
MAHSALSQSSSSLLGLESRRILAELSNVKRTRQDFAATENAQKRQVSQLAILGPEISEMKTPRSIDIIEGDHPLVAAWSRIHPQIHRILQQHKELNRSWYSIATLRIGYRLPDSSMPVTIIIIVDKSFDPPRWAEAEWQLKRMLDAHGFMEVEIEFEHGESGCDFEEFD